MLKGIAAGFLAYVLFSSSDASVKALGSDLPVPEILFLTTLASFFTFGFAKPSGERLRELFQMRRPHLVLVRAAAGVIGGLSSGYAFTTLPLAEAYSLIFLMPAFATMLSIPLLGDRVGWRRWLAVAVGFAGVLLVVRPGFRELHLGHLGAFVAAALAAVAMIVLRIIGPTEKRISLLATLYAAGLIVDGAFMAFDFVVPSLGELSLAAFAGVAGGFGQISMLTATRNAPPNRVAPTQYSQMLWAVVFGAVFFGEVPDGIAFVGMAFIVASGLFTLVREEQLHGWSRRTFLMRDRQ